MNSKKITKYLILVSLILISASSLCQEPVYKKVVALSSADIIGIRQDVAIAQKIVTLLWKKEELRSNFFILLAPLFKLVFDKKVSVEQLVTDYPSLAKYKTKLYKLLSRETPVAGIQELIYSLKRQGVFLVLANDSSLDQLNYNKQKKSDLYNSFNAIYSANDDKAAPSYYQKLRSYVNQIVPTTHATEILFVDSNKSHTDAAGKTDLNIAPLLFVGSDQLKDELVKKEYLITV